MTGQKLAIPAISLKQWVRNVFHFANVEYLSWVDWSCSELVVYKRLLSLSVRIVVAWIHLIILQLWR